MTNKSVFHLETQSRRLLPERTGPNHKNDHRQRAGKLTQEPKARLVFLPPSFQKSLKQNRFQGPNGIRSRTGVAFHFSWCVVVRPRSSLFTYLLPSAHWKPLSLPSKLLDPPRSLLLLLQRWAVSMHICAPSLFRKMFSPSLDWNMEYINSNRMAIIRPTLYALYDYDVMLWIINAHWYMKTRRYMWRFHSIF